MRGIANERSASSSTMTAELAPSSRTTFFLPERALRAQPTCGEPVKVRSFMRSSVTSASATSGIDGTTDSAPFGHAGGEAAGDVAADRSALVGGEAPRVIEGRDRAGDRGLDLAMAGEAHLVDDTAVERGQDGRSQAGVAEGAGDVSRAERRHVA